MGEGRLLTGEFKEIGAEMAAVCDVYEPNLQAGLKAASTGAKPFSDYRRLLDDKSIQAVIISTPDHWHARMAMDAAKQARTSMSRSDCVTSRARDSRWGNDPANQARLQVGTQRRSGSMFLELKQKYVRRRHWAK